jgi:hypothetical protein
MTRKLLIVFASGLLFGIVLLSSAWVVGGADLVSRIGQDDGWSLGDDNDDAPRSSKTFAFDGKTPLTIDMPVTLHFKRGPEAQVVVSGTDSRMKGLKWENGRLSTAGRHKITMLNNDGLKVTIIAPELSALNLNAPGNIELDDLDQTDLTIEASGAINLDASGKVKRLTVHSSGAGNLDMSDIEAEDANVRISGVGNADIAATGKVDVHISGAGKVSLHRKPAQLTSKISGLGTVDNDY